ncbi:MAG: 23S rRNA (pseudouridine(1915)-N(3))-methyltransferase RlmH [Verrucomicrobiota bacterium]
MFRLTVLAVGKLKNKPLSALGEDYMGRLRRHGRLDLVEIKDSDPTVEGERLLAALKTRSDAILWALSEEGKTMRSVDLAKAVSERQGGEFVFVIGGPFGLVDDVKVQADRVFSLSPMTFTHEMARVLLLEQLYRAVSINTGSKYHHD